MATPSADHAATARPRPLGARVPLNWRAVRAALGLIVAIDAVLVFLYIGAAEEHVRLLPMLIGSEGPKPAGAAPTASRLKRRDLQSAKELGRQLLAAPELDLDAKPDTGSRILDPSRRARSKFTEPILEPLVKRADLQGLPVAMGADCRLSKESAGNLQVRSRELRLLMSQCVTGEASSGRLDATLLRQHLLDGRSHQWRREENVPLLVQVLQAEDQPVRRVLIELLARIPGRRTSAALAGRALFDLSAEVREAAVWALAERPRHEYCQVLLDGLRYPWEPVADHAAEALVALHDRESLPQLTVLLDEPDPAQPAPRSCHDIDPALLRSEPWPPGSLPPTAVVLDEGQGGERRTRLLAYPADTPGRIVELTQSVCVVRELVRVNHLRNCLLCHAPVTSATDPVPGLIPTPGLPLPPPLVTPYYEGRSGLFVRADVTYLRQDFSVPQPVAKAGSWPAHQRYDYLVRTRYPTEAELRQKEAATYPQREAVRWALRELSGGKGS